MSVPEKVKLAAAALVSAAGWVSIWVVGAVVSTLQLKEAGEASALPALSTAFTSKVWEPSPRPLSSRGEVQLAQSPGWLESRRHSKAPTPEPPVSVPEKVKLAAAALVSADGWVSIWVVGAVVSTLQ